MSKISKVRELVRNGLYYLTEHADEEASADGFDVYDVEHVLLTGKIRRSWPREEKYEVVGAALDGRMLGLVFRQTMGGKIRVITAYEDRPRRKTRTKGL
ncbi:MAG: DUF4258 domain-containing protein [Acidobacteriota bacterium]